MTTTTYEAPYWLEDGMEVLILWSRAERTMLRCRVACAAGNAARVVNERRGVDTWLPIGDLRVPQGDPHAYSSR